MTSMKLANTISSVAKTHHVPFQGFDVDAITAKVQRHLDVTKDEVEVALELLCQKGS